MTEQPKHKIEILVSERIWQELRRSAIHNGTTENQACAKLVQTYYDKKAKD